MKNKFIVTKNRIQHKLNNLATKERNGFDGLVICIGLCLIGCLIMGTTKGSLDTAFGTFVSDVTNKVTNLGK